MSSDLLISAENISKKFCRTLKRSLAYGLWDVLSSFNPFQVSSADGQYSDGQQQTLRKGEFWSLQEVSFEVRRGECLGLIGHNGAGKSTLLKLLNGLLRPDSGRIRMYGQVGAMIELGAGLNPLLTGRENIYNQGMLLGFKKTELNRRFDEIVQFAEVEDSLDTPLQNYSSGMKTRLGFSVFAHLEPDVLLIDEVLAVGDAGFRMKSLNKMAEIIPRCAVIFVTHSMPQVFRVCSHLHLLNQGRTDYQGRDLAAGVTRYFEIFDASRETITGSGEARILAASAATEGQPADQSGTLTVKHNQSVEFRFHVQLEVHTSARMQILFWNPELLPVMDVVASAEGGLEGHCFGVDANGQAIVTVRIDHLLLNAGRYSVSSIILSEDLKVLCRHDAVLTVLVESSYPSGANVLLPAQWNSA